MKCDGSQEYVDAVQHGDELVGDCHARYGGFVLRDPAGPGANGAHPIAYAPEPELVSHCAAWEVFRRTEIVDLRMPYGYTAEQLAELVQSCAQKHGSVLLVCNKKSEARSIYQLLDGEPDTVCYHLSTSMCMAHRIRVLQAVDQSLRRPVRTICISTQLVEAGVDFSFGCVIRILAGLDHVVQAAGRCNRHGEKGSPVSGLSGQSTGRKSEQAAGNPRRQRACEDLLERFAAAPEEYDSDLVSGKAIQKYYEICMASWARKRQITPCRMEKRPYFSSYPRIRLIKTSRRAAVLMRCDRHSKQPDKLFPCFLTTPRMCWFHFKRERRS